MQTWQLTLWFSSLLAGMFVAGCTFGYTFSRNKHKKVAHASRKR